MIQEADGLYIGMGCFSYLLTTCLHVFIRQGGKKSSCANHHGQLGNWNSTQNYFLTTYLLSFMVHWWELVHCGQTSPSCSKASQETTMNGCVKMTQNQLFGQETTQKLNFPWRHGDPSTRPTLNQMSLSKRGMLPEFGCKPFVGFALQGRDIMRYPKSAQSFVSLHSRVL